MKLSGIPSALVAGFMASATPSFAGEAQSQPAPSSAPASGPACDADKAKTAWANFAETGCDEGLFNAYRKLISEAGCTITDPAIRPAGAELADVCPAERIAALTSDTVAPASLPTSAPAPSDAASMPASEPTASSAPASDGPDSAPATLPASEPVNVAETPSSMPASAPAEEIAATLPASAPVADGASSRPAVATVSNSLLPRDFWLKNRQHILAALAAGGAAAVPVAVSAAIAIPAVGVGLASTGVNHFLHTHYVPKGGYSRLITTPGFYGAGVVTGLSALGAVTLPPLAAAAAGAGAWALTDRLIKPTEIPASSSEKK